MKSGFSCVAACRLFERIIIHERMVHDIRWLLLTEEEQTEEPDVVYLWDNKVGAVSNGINYFDREAGEEPS